ncbi:uncharacterized protein DSM5745_05739 [Aspergillus mulundensis]|uniref:Fungal N-terminal domain-containing protein n=1 Tax=Aspergillus mulundensis TaxID=1810919 RepID=A0A3D8RXU5_9EURO|nr:hypothetical protein DSM5745_05739 [Aspergillus mulundensis]RDW78887.1 hypothetical protein DSM5745_05739 [Aspergillus mulundensis]
MADPAGLIALGIESCKLIVQYIDKWRSFDDDLDNIKVKAEGLLSTLKLISSLLSQNPAIQPMIAAEIGAKVLENEQWITKITNRVAKWSLATQNTGLSDKVRSAGKKITYPFRREALLDTVNILEGLQMNLHTALLALQLQQASLLVQQTHLVQTLGASTLSALQRHEAGFNSIESAIRNLRTPQPPVALGTLSRTQHAVTPRRRMCLCPEISSLIQIHQRSCPLNRGSAGSNSWTKRFAFASQWLGISVEAMISISRAANGFMICPSLRYHPIVSKDSPAFLILYRSPIGWEHGPPDWDNFDETVIHDLRQLFEAKKASPLDRAADGSTLLHAACWQFYVVTVLKRRSWMKNLAVIDYLVDAGCPVNEVSSGFYGSADYTPLDCLVNPWMTSDAISHMIDLGAVITEAPLLRDNNRVVLQEAFTRKEEGFLVSDIVHAVLSRSIHSLNSLLNAKATTSTGDPNIDPSSLLKLSLCWHDGFQALLEAYPDADKVKVLESAIASDDLEVTEALLKLDTALPGRSLSLSNSTEMERLVLDSFITRRKRLLELAQNTLPLHVQDETGMKRGILPDYNAMDVYLEVRARSTYSVTALEPIDDRSIYHSLMHSTNTILETLYQAGFHDINALSGGYSPLFLRMGSNFDINGTIIQEPWTRNIDRILWFVGKGATPISEYMEAKITYHHLVALELIHQLLRFASTRTTTLPEKISEEFSDLSVRHRDIVKSALLTGWHDECQCFCSLEGCTPFSWAFRHWFGRLKFVWMHMTEVACYHQNMAAIMEALVKEISPALDSARDVIRLFTFTDLSLTHTCCRVDISLRLYHNTLPFEHGDAREIHDEERFLLEDFEKLLEQLYEDYDSLSVPLWDFIETHWCKRIWDYLEQGGETVDKDALCVLFSKKVGEI